MQTLTTLVSCSQIISDGDDTDLPCIFLLRGFHLVAVQEESVKERINTDESQKYSKKRI